MAISGPLKWHGGKAYLASWLRSLAPAQGSYITRVHTNAGGLGEFWDWEHEDVAEVVNDINKGLTNFYDVLQDKYAFSQLAQRLNLTPFSEVSFKKACTYLQENPVIGHIDVPAAVAFFIRYRQSRQGLGKALATTTKRRTRSGMNEQVSAYLSAVDGLNEAHLRFRRVFIRNSDMIALIRELDDESTFFYLDPPYLPSTRKAKECYEYEMTFEQHDELLYTLAGIKGKFLISGYPSELYAWYAVHCGWRHYERQIDNKSSSMSEKEDKTEIALCNYLPPALAT